MRSAGLVIALAVTLQAPSAPARADLVCQPDDYSPSGANAYPGSAQHYQGSSSSGGVQRYQGSSSGIQERAGDRVAVPSGGRALPGNPNCYVVPHYVVENGAPCKR